MYKHVASMCVHIALSYIVSQLTLGDTHADTDIHAPDVIVSTIIYKYLK